MISGICRRSRYLKKTSGGLLIQACALAFMAMLALPIAAQAQNVDWLVNIDDAGFDPAAAGGNVHH